MLDCRGLEVTLEDYTPAMSAEALDLERECPQGTSFRIGFRRPTFHRRAENFSEHRIVTARLGGRLAGVVAVAVKDVELHGSSTQAAFLFDLRVHPVMRRRGIARLLAAEAVTWGLARAELAYTYAVSENRVMSVLGRVFAAKEKGAYAYLVIPTGCWKETVGRLAPSSFAEVHERMRAVAGPFDLYSNPASAMEGGGHVGSWIARRGRAIAGCSAWSNRGILAESVEAVPWPLRALGALERGLSPRRLPWPHVPRPGEELRSWYLFDFFATDDGLAGSLLRQVGALALSHGINYLYLPHAPGDSRVEEIRRGLPRLFSPVISYRLLGRMRGGDLPSIDRLYVDVRDV